MTSVGENWDDEFLDALPLWTLIRAFYATVDSLRSHFADFGLTPTQFGALCQLAEGDARSQAELARRVLVTPQSMHKILSDLEQRGLVAVQGAPGRGRLQRVEISAPGRALLSRIRPGLIEVNAPPGLGLTNLQAVELNELLHLMIAAMPRH